MDSYIITVAILSIALLSAAWLPPLLKYLSISYSVVYVAVGAILYLVIQQLPWPDPVWQQDYSVRLTELAVIIALMGTGLSIDKKFSFRGWVMPLRLVSVTMVLSIAALTALGYLVLGFDLPSSILFGAVLAPTDPVLAADVQVAPPNNGNEDEVHFALSAEAGLNDGMAFPFTWLAVAIAGLHGAATEVLWHWVWMDVFYRIIAGVIVGYVLGRLLFYLFFTLADRFRIREAQLGFIGVAITLFAYSVSELLHAYGFIAVFVAAITLRNKEMQHSYHETLHTFTEQAERILLVVLLLLFGGSLTHGLLDHLTWRAAIVAVLFLLLIRPVSAWLGLWGIGLEYKRKLIISFFGIRGIGSFFYLSFALKHASFQYRDEIWSAVAFTVLLSIVLHGATAARVIKNLKK